MRIRLNGGLEVEVNSYSYGYTYGSIIEGVPDQELYQVVFNFENKPNCVERFSLVKVNDEWQIAGYFYWIPNN